MGRMVKWTSINRRRWGVGGGFREWGNTRDIAEPTYKTLNLHRRLSTYLRDFQLTYKTCNLHTRHKPDRKQDFQQTYKTLNGLARLQT